MEPNIQWLADEMGMKVGSNSRENLTKGRYRVVKIVDLYLVEIESLAVGSGIWHTIKYDLDDLDSAVAWIKELERKLQLDRDTEVVWWE